jgi:hypothetical protein
MSSKNNREQKSIVLKQSFQAIRILKIKLFSKKKNTHFILKINSQSLSAGL